MQKFWNIAGIVLGIALIVTGVVFMLTSDGKLHTSFPSRDVEFGADFYTYQYSATRDAAENTAHIAYNSYSIVYALSTYCGAAFIAWGLLTIVHYGKAIAALPAPVKEEEEAVIPAE